MGQDRSKRARTVSQPDDRTFSARHKTGITLQLSRGCNHQIGDYCIMGTAAASPKPPKQFEKPKRDLEVANYICERWAVPEGKYSVKLYKEKSCFIQSAAFLPSGDIILADTFNNRLKLFDCFFQYLTHLDFPTTPQYVSCSHHYPLAYVTFPDRIRQIQVDNGILKRNGFVKISGICKGISVNRYDGKALSVKMSNTEGQVALLTPGGNIQQEIIKDDKGNNLFISPEYIAITKNLKIIISDKGSKSVIGLHNDGEVLFRYKGIRQPSGICCDEQGYIYVGCPVSIHQLNEEGELVKLFLSKVEIGFSPLSLSYCYRDNMMLVTGKGDRVSLFKLSA